ncbi:MAG: pyridoxine 5-phosphate synthase [Acidobacteriota bacterium]|jgi:pyridoxine 5'-phosphate synthase PdxJ|nr:pyridoxine 5-phosphate synthase [Acidobacteriota bacterium]
MTKLSVNLNKVALLRNARAIGIPSVAKAARICLDAGAHGLTLHPRPDERNAGHDLNLEKLGKFCLIPNISEVSIGHALISDALELGLFNSVQAYLKVMKR